MTKDEWKEVDDCLSGLFGFAELLVDGATVRFQRVRVTRNRLGIMTYVNGECSGEWISEENNCQQSQYLRPQSRFLYDLAARKKFKKWAKKDLSYMKLDPDKKFIQFTPFWDSATAIRRHYEKTFKSIEFVKAGGY